jgi:hypothetical protein
MCTQKALQNCQLYMCTQKALQNCHAIDVYSEGTAELPRSIFVLSRHCRTASSICVLRQHCRTARLYMCIQKTLHNGHTLDVYPEDTAKVACTRYEPRRHCRTAMHYMWILPNCQALYVYSEDTAELPALNVYSEDTAELPRSIFVFRRHCRTPRSIFVLRRHCRIATYLQMCPPKVLQNCHVLEMHSRRHCRTATLMCTRKCIRVRKGREI